MIHLGAFYHICHQLSVSLAALLDILIYWIYPLIYFYFVPGMTPSSIIFMVPMVMYDL